VFTGFAFYRPLKDHLCAVGVSGIIDSAFAPEILRRYALYNQLPIQDPKLVLDLDAIKRSYNVKREFRVESLDSLANQIGKWLH
jgi:hypothetical protein